MSRTAKTYVAPRPTPNPRPVDQPTALQVAELLEAIAAGLRAGTLDEAAVRATGSQWDGGRGPVVRVAVTVSDELLDQAKPVDCYELDRRARDRAQGDLSLICPTATSRFVFGAGASQPYYR